MLRERAGALRLLLAWSWALWAAPSLAEAWPPVRDPFDALARPARYSLKVPWQYRPLDKYREPGGEALFWEDLGAHYRYLPADNPLVECARGLSEDPSCMANLVQRRYMAYWLTMDPADHEVCCQPTKASRCIEPPQVNNLTVCGYPFGSVDHLPAFLPELTLRLPGGLVVRVLQGIGDEDLDCDSSRSCRLRPFHFQEIEARLLWSTSMAATLAATSGLAGQRAIDLGAGVGLTCVVLARQGAEVTCTDINAMALETMARNADANSVSLRSGYFNYSEPNVLWPRRVQPPYDVVVLGACPQDELRVRLPFFAGLFRALGRRGARVFVEDQGHSRAVRWGLGADNPNLWAAHGMRLADIFDPCLDRGYWPMPHGRIYTLEVL